MQAQHILAVLVPVSNRHARPWQRDRIGSAASGVGPAQDVKMLHFNLHGIKEEEGRSADAHFTAERDVSSDIILVKMKAIKLCCRCVENSGLTSVPNE